MPKSRHGGARHAQRPSWRYRLKRTPTTLAVAGIAALFIVSGALALRVLTVPSDLRAEATGRSGGHATPTRVKAATTAARVAQSDHRANRSAARTPSPTAKPKPAPKHVVHRAQLSRTTTSPSPTSSPKPKPKPSPSPSSSGPVPLPTFSP